ncbi:MAG: amino acid adenylation domain-containing protein, partial [bacterium]|nr:amino acid adenylation domain-containing protein [bacterium]
MVYGIEKKLLLTTSKFIKQKEYWVDTLAGIGMEAGIRFNAKKDRPYPGELEEIAISMPDALCQRLMKLGRKSEISIYIILLAALKTLIYRYTETSTDSPEVIVISPLYKRNVTNETLNESLLIHDAIETGTTFKELIVKIKKTLLEAYENQDYPLQDVLEYLFHRGEVEAVDINCNIVCYMENIHDPVMPEESKDKIQITFQVDGERIKGRLTYDSGIYDGDYLRQYSKHFAGILEHALADPGVEVANVTYMTAEEQEQLVFGFNRTEGDYPADKTVPQWFLEQVEKTPQDNAVVYENNRLTYEQLKDNALILAEAIKERGGGPGGITALLFDWSVEMIAAIMGTLISGGAYLPVDSNYPPDRIAYILKDSRAQVLITTKELSNRVDDDYEGEVLLYHRIIENMSPREEIKQAIAEQTGQHPAYIIYTSGSQGRPKGIVIEHRSFVDMCAWAVDEFENKPGYQVLLSNSYASDGSLQQIFPPLVTGGTLHLLNPDVRADVMAYIAYMKENRINNIDEVPAVMNIIFDNIQTAEDVELLPHLTCISLGSDHVPVEVARKCRKYLNHNGRIINAYGPAETSVEACTYHFDGTREDEKSAIGKPRRNLRAYILSPRGRCCPIGVPGEICISGIGLARGYINRPQLTAEKFVPNPHSRKPGDLLYKTGDQGRWMADGNIEFLGRIDQQIQIRGYRIELGEIETCLMEHPAVNDVVVLTRPDKSGDKYLCAYIVPRGNPTTTELKTFMTEKLPEYMVPTYFIFMQQFPLTPNSKVDRKALPEPEETTTQHRIPPENQIEETLVEIWSQILETDKENISTDANFFDIGGHSLRATMLLSKVHKEFEIKISMTDIFELETLKDMAGHIENATKETHHSIEAAPRQEYYPLSSAQKRLYILQQIEPGSTGYNMPLWVTLEGPLDKNKLENVLIEMIRRHEILRTSFRIVDEVPLQKIHETNELTFEVQYDDLLKTKGQIETVKENFVQPFELAEAPLLRVTLVKTGEEKFELALDMHHIIS